MIVPDVNRQAVVSLVVVALMSVCLPCKAVEPRGAESSLHAKTAQLYVAGNTEEAIEQEAQVLKAHPRNWMSHATMAYLKWQQGSVVEALDNGKAAVRLSPRNALALLNLAHMEQSLADFPAARADYQQAVKVAPDDPTTWLWLARCYMRNAMDKDALDALNTMAQRKGGNFEWYQLLTQGYLELDKPVPAIESAQTALMLAKTKEQKDIASVQLFDALLRHNRTEQAGRLKDSVFASGSPVESRVYVRAASALLDIGRPDQGKLLLEHALTNLRKTEDSDALFSLGEVLREKGVQSDADNASSWFDHANQAFRGAVALQPLEPRYQVALAALADRRGRLDDKQVALNELSRLNSTDSLAPYLMAHPTPKLSLIKFSIEGLTCGCQLGRVDRALSIVKGVVFVSLTHNQPYQGTMLIDDSTTAPLAFEAAASTAFLNYPKTQDPAPSVKFEQTAAKPMTTVAELLEQTLLARACELPPLPPKLPATEPVMPLSLPRAQAVSLRPQ